MPFFFFGSCHVSKYISQKRIVKLPTLLSPSLKFNSMNLLFAWAPGSGRDFRQAFVACQRVVETRIRNNSLQFYCFCFPASYFFLLLLLLFLPFIPLYPPRCDGYTRTRPVFMKCNFQRGFWVYLVILNGLPVLRTVPFTVPAFFIDTAGHVWKIYLVTPQFDIQPPSCLRDYIVVCIYFLVKQSYSIGSVLKYIYVV